MTVKSILPFTLPTLSGIVVASPDPSPTIRRRVGPSHTNRLRGGRFALEPCPPPDAAGGGAPGTVDRRLGPSSARTYNTQDAGDRADIMEPHNGTTHASLEHVKTSISEYLG